MSKSIDKTTDDLINFLDEKIIIIPNMRYVKAFYKNMSYEDKVKEMQDNGFVDENGKDIKVPLTLVRPTNLEQKITNGIPEKKLKFNLLIIIEDKDQEQGFKDIVEAGESVIDNMTWYPAKTGAYALDLSSITGSINYELSVQDYWVYEIEVSSYLYTEKPRMLEELGYI